jgi:hypothetical protein
MNTSCRDQKLLVLPLPADMYEAIAQQSGSVLDMSEVWRRAWPRFEKAVLDIVGSGCWKVAAERIIDEWSHYICVDGTHRLRAFTRKYVSHFLYLLCADLFLVQWLLNWRWTFCGPFIAIAKV